MKDGSPNVPAVRKGRPFVAGHDPRRGTNGGRRKILRDIEEMLDAEHRNVENMREVFLRLKFLAFGEVVEVQHKGQLVRIELKAQPDFMRLYLERVMGPVKDVDIDLSDAPPEVVEYLKNLTN